MPARPDRHGSITGYWIDGCTDESACPATPSCAAVAAGAPRQTAPALSPSTAKAARGQEVHGTVYGFTRGCKSEEDCPNVAAGGDSCSKAHHDYYADYRAKTRNGEGPALRHGTPYGYAQGCLAREGCPEHLAGRTSCRDAAAAEERRRRREAGIPELAPMVDSGPAIEHIALLRGAGMSLVAIALKARVSKTGVRTLVYGRSDYNSDGSKGPRHGRIPARIDAEKSRKILAVTPPAKRGAGTSRRKTAPTSRGKK